MEKIYLITGAAGFVGNNVARLLAEKNVKIRAFINTPGKEKLALSGLDVEAVYGDITNPIDIEKLFRANDNAEYIFIHAASMVDIGSTRASKKMHDINVNGTKNVLAACKANGVSRLVYVSSVHAIPELPNRELIREITDFDPALVHGGYAQTKAEASSLVIEAVRKGLNAVLVHPSGIVGPNDYSNTHMTQLIADFAAGKIPAGVKGGYDFVDVRDVARAIIAATEVGEAGRCWLVTGGYASVSEMLDMLGELFGRQKKLKTFSMGMARAGLPFLWGLAKITRKRPLYTRYSLYTLRSNSNFCHDLATQELNHNPRPLKASLSDAVDFFRQRADQKNHE